MSELRPYPIKIGIEEAYDPKQAPPGSLHTCENMWPDKVGRVRKRGGTTGLVKTVNESTEVASIASGTRLLTRGSDIGLLASKLSYTYISQLTKWGEVARYPSLHATTRQHIDTTRTVEEATCAVYQDLLVTAFVGGDATGASYVTTGPLYVQVDSITTKAPVLRQTMVVSTAASFVRIAIVGTSALVYWTTEGGELHVRALSLTTLTLGVDTTVATGLFTSSPLDVWAVGTDVYAVYALAAGADRLRIAILTNGTTVGVTQSLDGASPLYACLGIHATAGEHVYVAVADRDTPGCRIAVLAPTTLNVTTAITSISTALVSRVAVIRATASSCLLAFHTRYNGSGTYAQTITQLVTSGGSATATSVRGTFHMMMASKPWVGSDSRFYMVMTTDELDSSITGGRTHAIVEIETSTNGGTSNVPHRHVATLESRTASVYTDVFVQFQFVTQTAVDSSSRVYVALPFATSTITRTDEGEARGVVLATIEVPGAGHDFGRNVILGPNALVMAGAPFVYDGTGTFPVGFLREPRFFSATPGGAGTGAMVDGVYRYIAVYEWRDRNGILHRSAPAASIAATVASGANTGSVALVISTATLSGKQDLTTGFGATSANPVVIALYRTTVGGSIHYRLTHPPDANMAFNSPLAATVAFTDTVADADIVAGLAPTLPLSEKPQVYTEFEFDEIAPPSAVTGFVHRGRAAILGPDRRTVWFTKDLEEDPTIFPGFNEALTLYFDTEDKYAINVIDEKWVVTGADTIDVVVGDGPNSNGDQNDWRIYRVQTDAGCTSPRSMVTTPLGLAFLSSRRSFELLGRDLSVKPIGSSVEDVLAAFPVVTSAVLVARDGQARWTCIESDGSNGVVIVWDYMRNFWCVWKYYDTDASTASCAFVDAALIGGVYTLLTANGKVYQESTSNFLDGGSQYVEGTVVFNEISETGANGWSRVKGVQILGESKSNHDLSVSIARDYASSYEQTKTFAAGSDVTAVSTLEKAHVTLDNQKLQAVRVRVKDATPTNPGSYPVGTGEGFTLSGIALDVQPKRGPAKTSSGRKG